MENSQQLTRKERERLARKKEILNAAIKLFAQNGFEKTTLNDIANEAEFGKGTLYSYFKSKEDLFATLFRETVLEFQEFLMSSIAHIEDIQEKLAKTIDLTFEYFEQNETHFQLFVTEIVRSPKLREEVWPKLEKIFEREGKMMEHLIQEGIEAGLFENLHPRRTTLALKGMIHSQLSFACPRDEIDYKKSAETVKHIFFSGIIKTTSKNN